MNKILIISIIAPLLLSACMKQKPNILIIQVDDMGYDDLSINGNTVSNTPNLDVFSEEAIRFDNFMLNSVCAPTRASLLTGRDFLRTGVTGVHAGKDFLNLDETTFANVFQNNGYHTGMWGKWHSGKADGYWPWDRGFDEAYYAELYKYFPSRGYYNEHPKMTWHENEWSPKVLTDYAIDFISRHKKEPFLAYVSYLTCHTFWDTPDAYKKKYRKEGRSENFAILLGMLEFMDEQVGRLLKHLQAENLDENTIILFMSDNGPNRGNEITEAEWELRNNHQFVSAKGNLYQNGIKSPLYIRWKSHYHPKDIQPLVTITDIFPTLLEIANIPLPKKNKRIDGQSLCPLIEGKKGWKPKSAVFSQWFAVWEKDRLQPITLENRATFDWNQQMLTLINDDYKLLQNAWRKPRAPEAIDNYVLIDLKNDPLESTNIYKEKPKVVEKMKAEMANWYEGIKNEEAAYSSPVFQIGWKGKTESEVLAYGLSKGEGVTNNNFWVSDIDSIGDKIFYDIYVHKKGTYDLYMEVGENQSEGFEMAINCKNQSKIVRLSNTYNQNMGQFRFNKGAHTLSLQVTKTPLNMPSSFGQLKKLKFIRQ